LRLEIQSWAQVGWNVFTIMTRVDRLGSPGCCKREGVSEMASGIVFEVASGNTFEVVSEVIFGIPSGIISGIQGPQLLQHFQDLYQVAWRQDYIGSDTVLPRRTRETCVYSRSHKLLKKPSTELKLPGTFGGSAFGA
jgi:hypothetical protein